MNFTLIPTNATKPPQFPTLFAPSTQLRRRPLQFRASAFDAAVERRSHYELLGIDESGSASEIKRAYKQLALKYHPDVSPPECAAENSRHFIQLNEAYSTLSDPGRRAVYDRGLAGGLPFEALARRCSDEEMSTKACWRNNWQDQLAELVRLRAYQNENSVDKLSWAAKMRKRRSTQYVVYPN